MMKRIGDIFRQYYFLMPSKFNLKKGLQDQPANVIQLQKGPKIGDLTNLIQKNCISTQKKVEEGSISPQNHSRFFSPRWIVNLQNWKRRKRATISWPICYNFFSFSFHVWTYKWSCGLDNSSSFQRRRNVMIHPNTWINVNNFFFDWSQFVVRIAHGFLVTLQFGHIFGVLTNWTGQH